MSKKIFIIGCDQRWATGTDEVHYRKALTELGYRITYRPWEADCIVAVTWYHLLTPRYIWLKRMFPRKRYYAVLSSNPASHLDMFEPIRHIVDDYIYFNSQQRQFLLEQGIREEHIHYNPVYVNETLFLPSSLSRAELASRLRFNPDKLQNRYVIGSLQRDSSKDDLRKPKWQKGPELMIEILRKLDPATFILLLAGPRRHYVIHECRKYGIPYCFAGDESAIDAWQDDFAAGKNFLTKAEAAIFYNLVDSYLISSKSEGAPMAAVEASLCAVPVISSRVGMAQDYLPPEVIYDRPEQAAALLEAFMANPEQAAKLGRAGMERTLAINNYSALLERTDRIFAWCK